MICLTEKATLNTNVLRLDVKYSRGKDFLIYALVTHSTTWDLQHRRHRLHVTSV